MAKLYYLCVFMAKFKYVCVFWIQDPRILPFRSSKLCPIKSCSIRSDKIKSKWLVIGFCAKRLKNRTESFFMNEEFHPKIQLCNIKFTNTRKIPMFFVYKLDCPVHKLSEKYLEERCCLLSYLPGSFLLGCVKLFYMYLTPITQ